MVHGLKCLWQASTFGCRSSILAAFTWPRRAYLRDTLWAVATVETGPSFEGQSFGEVLIPMLAPFSWQHASDEVKLGHSTDWKQEGDLLIPFGQKLLVLDEETTIPFLEIRELRFEESVQASGVS